MTERRNFYVHVGGSLALGSGVDRIARLDSDEGVRVINPSVADRK